jgi:hypothetical protein
MSRQEDNSQAAVGVGGIFSRITHPQETTEHYDVAFLLIRFVKDPLTDITRDRWRSPVMRKENIFVQYEVQIRGLGFIPTDLHALKRTMPAVKDKVRS